MAQNANNVAAPSPLVGGGISAGPKGTALPTDTSTTLNAAFKSLGLVNEDGLVPASDAPSTDPQKAWGGATVANIVTDLGTRKFTFTLLEVFNSDVASFVFGSANVTITAPTTTVGTKLAIMDKLYVPDPKAVVFDWAYLAKAGRFAIPLGSAIVTSELPIVHSALTAYEIELTCLPDANGVSVYRYYTNDDHT